MRGLLCLCLVLPLLFAQSTKDKPDPDAGKAVFEARCEMCHEAESDEPKTGPGLKGVKNGKLPSGMKATRENILELVDDGRDEMPPFKDVLTAKEKEDVIAFVLTL